MSGAVLGSFRVVLWVCCALGWALLGSSPAGAASESEAPLVPLAADRARALAPLLRGSDLVLVESQPSGSLKQITLLTLVAARPETVREVVFRAERYPDFIRQLKGSQISRSDDGSLEHAFQIDLGILRFEARNRIAELPASPDPARSGAESADSSEPRDLGSDVRPLELVDPEPSPGGRRRLRLDFYAAGGGTVLAVCAYSSLASSPEPVHRLLATSPLFQHGIVAASALSFALLIKRQAEVLTGSSGVVLPASGPADYDPLLLRGPVALLRSRDGRLRDISVVLRSSASREGLLDAARQAARWPETMPILASSQELIGTEEQPMVDLRFSLPLLVFQSRYAVHTLGYGVDLLAVAGELLGSRLRFDIQAATGASEADSAPASRLILRGQHSFDRASQRLRQLYRSEPLWEYGVNFSLYFILAQGVRRLAEGSAVMGSAR